MLTIRDQNGLPILAKDEYMRPGTDMQTLGALKPAFKDMGEMMPGFDKVAILKYPHLERIDHIHHAGNSSGIVDGAAAVAVASVDYIKAHGIKPRARIRAVATLGTEPLIMLPAPAPTSLTALKAAGMKASDM